RGVLLEGGAVELTLRQDAVAEPDRVLDRPAELQPLHPGVLDRLAGAEQLERRVRGQLGLDRRRLLGRRLRDGEDVLQPGFGHGQPSQINPCGSIVRSCFVFSPKGWDNLARGETPGQPSDQAQALKGRNSRPVSPFQGLISPTALTRGVAPGYVVTPLR